MNCPNCGSPLREGASFCPVCGKEVVYSPVDVPKEREVVDSPGTGDKSLKIVLIVLISLVVAIALAVGIYFIVQFVSNADDEPTLSTCEECGEEFEGSGDLCEDCEEEKEKEDKKKEDKDEENDVDDDNSGNDNVSSNAKECNQCYSELDTEGLLCSDCLNEIKSSEYSSGYRCNMCTDRISEEEIAIVDGYGLVYCEFCDEEVYCEDCNAPLSRNDDDNQCHQCADHSCYNCGEVLEGYEVEGTDEYGNEYCYACYISAVASTCNQCSDSHNNEGLLCSDCLDGIDEEYYYEGYKCFWCEEHLDRNEIAIVDYEGLVYCQDCDHGDYCASCYAPLSLDNSSGYCSYCE